MKNEPAYPCVERRNTSSDPLATPREIQHTGMTLRDRFAIEALPQAMDLCARDALEAGQTRAERFAQAAYRVADAMLVEREKASD